MDSKERIKELRKRFKRCVEHDRSNRERFEESLKFAFKPGEQWDVQSKKDRGNDRPMYEYNRTRITVKRVINEMRANRPQGKVRGVENNDYDLAEIYEGLCRNIWNISSGDNITDDAATYQVAGGYAAWSVMPEYSSDTAFDQDIKVRQMKNPLCLYCDPDAIEITGADAAYWIYTEKLPEETFKKRYPKAKPISFDEDDIADEDNEDWSDENGIRIAQYWFKEPYEMTLYLMSDGSTVEEKDRAMSEDKGLTVIKSRDVICNKIMHGLYSGDAEIEPPQEFAGTMFPWVRTFGEYVIIEGKVEWYGMVTHMMDAQRAFNLAQTSIIETIARAPLAQNWATPRQAEGMQTMWAEANKKALPYQLYNPDPQSPGPPVRIGGADVPVALVQQSQLNAEEIKANSGIFDNSLGNNANENSGVAIARRAAQGQMVTFNFPDNMAKAVERTWKIMIDLIPKIYDTPRSIRILGADLAEKYIKVNQVDENGEIKDITRGKYDVVVTVGPSFATQRQEAVEAYTNIAQTNPAVTQVAGDLMFKAMDLPYADQIAERMKAILPPQIQQTLNQDQKIPPEVQQMMMQAEQAMQAVQQQGQLVQQAAQEAEQVKAGADKAKSDVQIAIANLKVAEAQFEAKVAQFHAEVADTRMQMSQEKEVNDADTEKEQLGAQLQTALAQIQQQAADFMTQAASVITQMQQAQPQVVVANSPSPRVKKLTRVNGELIPIYEDTVQ